MAALQLNGVAAQPAKTKGSYAWTCALPVVFGLLMGSVLLRVDFLQHHVQRTVFKVQQGRLTPPQQLLWKVQLPIPPTFRRALPPRALARGVQAGGLAERFKMFAAKLFRGEPVHVVVVGGSISAGTGCPEAPYPPRFFAWLNATFPHPHNRLRNAAMGATGTPLYAFCTNYFVPQDADLVVLEFAYNVGHACDPFKSPVYHQSEQLVRNLLELPSRPALVLLHHYAYWYQLEQRPGVYFNSAEDSLSLLAQYYDFPEVSLRRAAYHLMRERAPGFKIDKRAKFHVPKENHSTTDLFYHDRIHPTCLGQQALADLLDALTWQGVQAVATAEDAPAASASRAGDERAGSSGSSGPGPGGGALPPPMTPGPAQNLPTKCWIADRFKSVVTATEGDFAYVAARPQASSFVLQKWAWTGTTPGSWAEITLNLRGGRTEGERAMVAIDAPIGGGGSSGNSSAVGWTLLLGHMRGYEGFGTARTECHGGCNCKPSKFNCIWDKKETLHYNHIIKNVRLVGNSPGPCQLRVTIQDKTSSQGHKVSLTSVIATQGRVDLNAFWSGKDLDKVLQHEGDA